MKYLITDPCYLLGLDDKNRDRIWNRCINDIYGSENSNKYDDNTDYTGVQKILSEELGLNVLRVSDTGYGDWSNSISSTSAKVKIIKNEFYADAGMMCVVEINDKLENYLKYNSIGAVFEINGEIDIRVNDSDSNWYILEITDKDRCRELVTSEESEMDDYEEDEYEDDEDYSEEDEEEFEDLYLRKQIYGDEEDE